MAPSCRLQDTTLGDILGALHRAHATGVLELRDEPTVHAVHLRRGLVAAVESTRDIPRLGDLVHHGWAVPRAHIEQAWARGASRGWRIGQCLVGSRVLSHAARDAALDLQRTAALEGLFALPDAVVCFHPARPLPPGAAEQPPLPASTVLHGRARRRDGVHAHTHTIPLTVRRALAALGLPLDATPATVRDTWRTRVRALHPDLAPAVSEAERARRAHALSELMAAYAVLSVAASSR